MPKNPRLPVPELVVSERYSCYGWKCEKHGIQIYSDSKAAAPQEWLAAYKAEYFPEH